MASVDISALFSPFQISGLSDITQQIQDLLQLANFLCLHNISNESVPKLTHNMYYFNSLCK